LLSLPVCGCRIASEAGSVKALSEELRGKLGVLELERQAAYAAVQ